MKILLTLDGSSFAESAIPLAQRLAAIPGTEVHLLAVVPPQEERRLYGEPDRGSAVQRLPHPSRLMEEPAPIREFVLEHYLESVARLFPQAIVHPAMRVGPHPAEQILAYSETHGIDMIVMATHGRSQGERPTAGDVGTVAAAVVDAGVAPVLLVHPIQAA